MRNSVLEELRVRRLADIQEEMSCRAVWRWEIQVFKCWVSPDYDPQCFRSLFMVHRKTFSVFHIFLEYDSLQACKTMMLDISQATLAYSILENFRRLGT